MLVNPILAKFCRNSAFAYRVSGARGFSQTGHPPGQTLQTGCYLGLSLTAGHPPCPTAPSYPAIYPSLISSAKSSPDFFHVAVPPW